MKRNGKCRARCPGLPVSVQKYQTCSVADALFGRVLNYTAIQASSTSVLPVWKPVADRYTVSIGTEKLSCQLRIILRRALA
jgi:hypothetical protein